jgi:hypothetical protein
MQKKKRFNKKDAAEVMRVVGLALFGVFAIVGFEDFFRWLAQQ